MKTFSDMLSTQAWMTMNTSLSATQRLQDGEEEWIFSDSQEAGKL